METVALQLLFGSDPLREAYCFNRARHVDAGRVSDYWANNWNVLYRPLTVGGPVASPSRTRRI